MAPCGPTRAGTFEEEQKVTVRTTVRPLLAAALMTTMLALAAPQDADAFARTLIPADAAAIVKIAELRRETSRWRKVMGLGPIEVAHGRRELATTGRAYRRWVLRLWTARAGEARWRARHPPHHDSWLCIHRHERSPSQGWRTNTGNGYYGGLQMDISFQRTYGARLLRTKGTADRWTPLEQIWVALKAHGSGRGFHPWPNTARACGLL